MKKEGRSTDDLCAADVVERALLSVAIDHFEQAEAELAQLTFLIAAYRAGESIMMAKLRYQDGMVYPGE